jgi:hypothetical protein
LELATVIAARRYTLDLTREAHDGSTSWEFGSGWRSGAGRATRVELDAQRQQQYEANLGSAY